MHGMLIEKLRIIDIQEHRTTHVYLSALDPLHKEAFLKSCIFC